ncbi:MAG: hypothetical protein LBG65_07915 [Puniceicoccales bacterium]|jgi:hypothetical protein|nr:hypothetical protein [Puniceicoccales bacterium]
MKSFPATLLFFFSLASLGAAPTPFGTPISPGAATPAVPGTPPAPPAPSAAPPVAPPAAPAPAPVASTSGDYSSGTVERAPDKIFDVNRDSVDLETGTLRWKDKTFSLGDSKVLRARLERYLASPAPNDDVVQHAKILAEIETLLSPQKITRQNFNKNYQRAWDLLFKAGEFESDGENSLTIASQVMKVYRDKQEARKLLISQKQQELERKYQSERTIVRARALERRKDLAANRVIAAAAPRSSAKGGDPAPAPSGGSGGAEHTEGTADLEEHRSELGKMDASIRKTEATRTALEWKSRLEFQSQIVSLLFQRRWQHAGIATAFYRHTFDDSSAQELRVGEKEIKSMFPVSNFSPTLDTVDALARTARSDVATGIKAVRQLYDSGRRYKAFERLQETFFLGEYTQEIMFFDPDKKTVLLELWQDLQLLQKVGDERDLDAVDVQLRKIAAAASDFPAAQVESRVRNARRASNLALFAAKQSAFANDPEKSAQHLERSTKLWPQNPAIEEFTRTLESRADTLSRLVPEFDALHKDRKFREIFKRKEAFGLAVAGDAGRSALLKESLDLTAKIEGAVMQSKILKESGNACMAWDVLEEAHGLDSGDEVLMAARMGLVPMVGDYANRLSRAAAEENSGHYGASLAWYLAAQEKNPSSEIARKALARVGEKLLKAVQDGKGGSAK